jgi:hypothetical protein
MRWNPLRWNIGDTWLGIKRPAAKCTKLVFALAALLSFGVVAVQFGADALSWLKTGTWGSAKTIAEVWPAIANFVAGIEWIGVKRIGLWVIARSVVWAYIALGLVCFTIGVLLAKSKMTWSSASVSRGSIDGSKAF